MFKVSHKRSVAKRSGWYLSFPDIIKHPRYSKVFYLVYREGNQHHPTWSNLVLMKTEDEGKRWEKINVFPMNLEGNGRVWNCPRLFYEKSTNTIDIVCDTKSGTRERIADFKTFFIRMANSKDYYLDLVPFTGMVPDKIISFKNKLFCANHKIKSPKNDLIQLVNWSEDGGICWYDCNVVAHDFFCQFCEASLVNVDDEYLIAYLRDNSDHRKPVRYVKSKDGINWSQPEILGDIVGHRVTAIRYRDMIIGSYRNTEKVSVSLFYHPIGKENEVKYINVDSDYKLNLYHYGYTGISITNDEDLLLTYYIKKLSSSPHIRVATLNKI